MKRISGQKVVNTAKLNMLKLVPKLKTNKSLKLLLVDMKAEYLWEQNTYEIGNSRDGTKQAKMPYFHCGPSRWVENQISWIS